MANILREIKDFLSKRRCEMLAIVLTIGVFGYLIITDLSIASVIAAWAIFFCLIYFTKVKIALGLGKYLSPKEIEKIIREAICRKRKLEKEYKAICEHIEGQDLVELSKLSMLIKFRFEPQKNEQEVYEWNFLTAVLFRAIDEVSLRLIEVYKDKQADKEDIPRVEKIFIPFPNILPDVWFKVNKGAEKLGQQAVEQDYGEKREALQLQAESLLKFSKDCLLPLAIKYGYVREAHKTADTISTVH